MVARCSDPRKIVRCRQGAQILAGWSSASRVARWLGLHRGCPELAKAGQSRPEQPRESGQGCQRWPKLARAVYNLPGLLTRRLINQLFLRFYSLRFIVSLFLIYCFYRSRFIVSLFKIHCFIVCIHCFIVLHCLYHCSEIIVFQCFPCFLCFSVFGIQCFQCFRLSVSLFDFIVRFIVFIVFHCLNSLFHCFHCLKFIVFIVFIVRFYCFHCFHCFHLSLFFIVFIVTVSQTNPV